jgi:hypothetical protein
LTTHGTLARTENKLRYLFLLVALVCGSVSAAQLTPQQALDSFKLAYGQYGGPPQWLETMPPVNIVPQQQLCWLLNRAPSCTAQGTYRDGEVYVSDELDFALAYDASILLHENIHHFQELDHGPSDDAQDVWYRECEAYRIQAEVLAKAGASEDAVAVEQVARGKGCEAE